MLRHLGEGWPNTCPDPALLPYFNKRQELTMQDGCLVWGGRVVIPSPGRESLLGELHGGHLVSRARRCGGVNVRSLMPGFCERRQHSGAPS